MMGFIYGAYDANGKRKYLTIKEGRAFLTAARNLPISERLFCEAMFYLGVRISEVLALNFEDIDQEESTVCVRCLKKRGKNVVRRIPLPRDLMESIVNRSADKGRLWDMCRMSGWRIVKGAMLQAGISGIHASPKGLRHGFGVRAALANIPVNVIQRWMGHSSPLTTAIYLAVKDDEERELIARTWA